jgi:hypothetical protein
LYAIAASDITANGLLDLVVANFSANSVSVLTGKGNGKFVTPSTGFSTAIGPSAIVIGNFDGTKPAVAAAARTGNLVTLLYNTTP